MNGFSQIVEFYVSILNNILQIFPIEIHWLIILLILGVTISALVALFKFIKDKILLIIVIVILIPGIAPLLLTLFQAFFIWLMR